MKILKNKYIKWGLIGFGIFIVFPVILVALFGETQEKEQVNQQEEITSKLPASVSEPFKKNQSQSEPESEFIQPEESQEPESESSKPELDTSISEPEPEPSSPSPPLLPPTKKIICSYNAYNCSDFTTHAEAQGVFEHCGGINNDIHRLDRDKDGIACESLP